MEMKNLAIKNNYFPEEACDDLTDQQKARALPILMFMIMKRNRLIKSRGVVNGKVQKLHSDDEFLSPVLDFYAVKYICALAAKEERDVATVDLPGFFL